MKTQLKVPRSTFLRSALLRLASTACAREVGAAVGPDPGASDAPSAVARPAGWAEESHGKGGKPNFAVVFPQTGANQMTITITPESWQAMQDNMVQLFGSPGSRGGAAPGAAARGARGAGGGPPAG